jgi:hypothetical protein
LGENPQENDITLPLQSPKQATIITAIFRPEWSSLDYIEIPNEKWFLTEDGNELYEFDNGIFIAHPQMEEGVFDTFGVIKILPDNAFITEVEQLKQPSMSLTQHQLSKHHQHGQPSTIPQKCKSG